MRCKNCGSMNSDGAKFCESCGATIESVNVQQNQSGSGSNTYNLGNIPDILKKLPKNLIFGVVGAIAAFLLILIVVLTINSNKVIDLNKYISFESSGYDGYGKASISIDWERLDKDYGKKIKYSSKGKKEYGVLTYAFEPMYIFKDAISGVELDKSEKLSNGDKVKYTWRVNEDSLKYVNYKLKYKDGEFEVSKLYELSKFDPFKDIKVEFSGIAPEGKAELTYSGDDILHDYNFEFDKHDNLKNGDTVTVNLKLDEDKISFFATSYGRVPEKMSESYTVSGLDTYVTKYSEFPEDFIKEANDKAKEVIKEYTESAYGEGTTLSDLKYEGYAFKTNVEGYNALYIVYSRVLTSVEHKYVTTKMYYPVAFKTLMLSDKISYKTGPELVGKSYGIGENSSDTKGFKFPSELYKSDYKDIVIEVGDGFEKFKEQSYVHKLEDMTDEYRKALQDEARITLDEYIAKDYKPNMQLSDIEFAGEYLQYTSDDKRQFNGTNIYFVVFKANLSDVNGKFPTTTIYYPIEYTYIMKLSDNDFTAANNTSVFLNYTTLPNTYDTTRGFIDGNEMYNKIISNRTKLYEHQVSDSLKQFGE